MQDINQMINGVYNSYRGAGFGPALTQATCCHASPWAGCRQGMNQAELGCWSAIRCQFPWTQCVRDDLRGNADPKSAFLAWFVPGQDSAAVELPRGDSRGQRVPLTQQEKQGRFKRLWHLVPRPGIFHYVLVSQSNCGRRCRVRPERCR